MKPLFESVKKEMSEADKLFEKLGYRIETDEEDLLEYKKQLSDCSKFIRFNLYDRIFTTFYYIAPHDNQSYFDMQELKAINKKCLELGWIKE